MSAQPELTLQPEERGQGAGNQQQVVEVPTKKRAVRVWADKPTVDGIQRARHQEQPVAHEAKCRHSSARITSPKPRATRTLRNTIMGPVLRLPPANATGFGVEEVVGAVQPGKHAMGTRENEPLRA